MAFCRRFWYQPGGCGKGPLSVLSQEHTLGCEGAQSPAACVKSLNAHVSVGSVSSFPPTPPPPDASVASLSFQSENTWALAPFKVSALAESQPSPVKFLVLCVPPEAAPG